MPTAAPTSSPGRIIFHGQAPGNTNYGHIDPLNVCPNTVTANGAFNNPTGNVTSQPYRFEFDTECLGNYYDLSRPPFVWMIKYLTESGRIYEEQLGDYTTDDYSKMMFYLYDRVPTNGTTPTNQAATAASGNGNTFVTTNSGTANTAQPGEPIYGIRLECSGYSCLVTDDNDAIDIRYYGRRPDAISLNGATLPLCRNQTYTVSTNAVLGASNYNWTASNGATLLGIAGNPTSVVVDLSSVLPNATSITLRVAAFDYNNCGGAANAPRVSATRELVVPVQRPPAQPANMQINGVCPSATDVKYVSVNPVNPPVGEAAGSIRYHWYITGPNTAGAYLIDGAGNSTQDADFSTNPGRILPIYTPNAGSVTVNVEARSSPCGGPGPVLSNTFQIGDITPTPPTVTVVSDFCTGTTFVLQGQPGQSYYIARQPYNISIPGGTATVGNGASPTSTILPFSANFNKGTFDIDLLVTSPCQPAGSSGYVTCTLTMIYVPKQSPPRPCRPAGPPQPEAVATAAVRLYPNPATGTVAVQSDVPTVYQWVKVLNLQGRTVLDRKAADGKGVQSFDVHELPAGLYEVQLFDGRKLTTQRLQKD